MQGKPYNPQNSRNLHSLDLYGVYDIYIYMHLNNRRKYTVIHGTILGTYGIFITSTSKQTNQLIATNSSVPATLPKVHPAQNS